MKLPPTLIETVRVRNGEAPLWGLHLRRLVASCRTLGIPFPTSFSVPGGGPDRVHRLEVGPRGMTVSEREAGSARPVHLRTSSVPHPGYPHKTTERAAFARALEEARAAGGDDALLLTRRGEVAEATIWCLFWWEGDRLAAPALDLGILSGVSRMRIEELHGPVAARGGRRERHGRPVRVGLRLGLRGRTLDLALHEGPTSEETEAADAAAEVDEHHRERGEAAADGAKKVAGGANGVGRGLGDLGGHGNLLRPTRCSWRARRSLATLCASWRAGRSRPVPSPHRCAGLALSSRARGGPAAARSSPARAVPSRGA